VQQRKGKTNPPQTTKKRTVSRTHNNKNNNTCEKCDPMKLEVVVYSKDTTADGVATERERESTLTAFHT
jgi:hypothetical protein